MSASAVVPEFIPNQVLTDRQLNQLRDFLCDQDMDTRARLVGTGIVCGLNSKLTNGQITIDAGFGITSSGYLVEFPGATFGYCRKYAEPKTVDPDIEKAASYFSQRLKGGSNGTLWELLSDPNPESGDHGQTLDLTVVTQSVLVLYLEQAETELTSCLMTDCDAQGRNLTYTVRPLLIQGAFNDVCFADSLVDSGRKAAVVELPRLTNLSATTADNINAAYAALLKGSVDALLKNAQAAIGNYGDALGLPGSAAKQMSDAAVTISTLTSAGVTQYHYDFIKDLNTAYNEAVSAASEFLKCYPAGDFPRHLALGTPGKTGWADPSRQVFVPSPTRNVNHGLLQRTRALFERMVAVAVNVNLKRIPAIKSEDQQVFLTPSHTELFPLGKRALPFYYDSDATSTQLDSLRRLWPATPFEADDVPWSYDGEAVAGLAYQYPRATLLRIEGHVGLPSTKAVPQLQTLKQSANAEFEILCSYLKDSDPEHQSRQEAIELFQKRRAELIAKIRQEIEKPVLETSKESSLSTNEAVRQACGKLADLELKLIRDSQQRYSRELYCDTACLESDYLSARSGLLNICNQMLTPISVLKAFSSAITAKDMQDISNLIPQIRRLAEERTMAAICSCRRPKDLDLLLKFIDLWLTELKAHPEAVLQFLLWIACEAARQNIQALVDLYLPRQLSTMEYEIVLDAYKAVSADLVRLRLVSELLQSVINDQAGLRSDFVPDFVRKGIASGGVDVLVGTPVWFWSSHALERRFVLADLYRSMSEIVHGRMAVVAVQYEDARAKDLSLFANVTAIDGLEHTAGVSKGGTFVVVVENESVVADFAFMDKPTCSSNNGTAKLSLPPVALTDFRIGMVRAESPAELQLDINLLDDIYDPDCNNFDRRQIVRGWAEEGADWNLEIGDLGKNPDLVGTVTSSKTRGTVIYSLDKEKARPGLIDRFTYRIARTSEPLSQFRAGDIGEVFILLLPFPEAAKGSIAGIVYSDAGSVAANAEVRLPETHQSLTADTKGIFGFGDLAPGRYSLQASLGRRVSDPVAVDVKSGSATPVVITLQPLATLRVQIRDASGAAVTNITVVLSVGTTAVAHAATNDTGNCTLEVPAGKYSARALSTGVSSPAVDLELGPGETKEYTLTLKSEKVAAPGGLYDKVSERQRISRADAQRRVSDLYADRYAHRYETIVEIGKDPHIVETDSYKKTDSYVTMVLPDPEITDDKLTATYAELVSALSSAYSAAPDQEKKPIRELITLATLGTLDRITLSNPETLSTTAQSLMKQADTALQTAQADRTRLSQSWDAGRLEAELGLPTAKVIAETLR